MPPFQYDLRCSAAKAVAPRNLDAATAMPSAYAALQNTIQRRFTTTQENADPKPDLDAEAEKCTILKALG